MSMNRADAYYEPEDFDDRWDEIEERAWQLMKTPQFDPYQAGNISEMMGELSVDMAKDLQAILDTHDFEQIGRKIWAMTYDYMEKYAKDQAEGEL